MRTRLFLAIFVVAILSTGCAAYRTEGPVEFDSTNVGAMQPVIPVEAIEWKGEKIDLQGKTIQELGTVEATVSKLTAFHSNPTRKQADIALAWKAKVMGADAVIDVTYDSGIGLFTWGKIEAKGTAIKILEDEG